MATLLLQFEGGLEGNAGAERGYGTFQAVCSMFDAHWISLGYGCSELRYRRSVFFQEEGSNLPQKVHVPTDAEEGGVPVKRRLRRFL